jgi:hypothetical protein
MNSYFDGVILKAISSWKSGSEIVTVLPWLVQERDL